MRTIKDLREAWDFLFDWSDYITDEAMDEISSKLHFLKLLIVDELSPKMKLRPKAEKNLKKIEKMLKSIKIWKKSILE